MENLFDSVRMAEGYGHSRPAVHPHIIERIRARLRLVEPLDSALDVGCGAGLSTRALRSIARHCTGVDPSDAMVQRAAASTPGASFMVGRAEALPVRAHSMDLITAAGSLNFANLSLFFPEVLRVLRPGGVLAVYDFSEGRSCRGSTRLGLWYSEFLRRYPSPPGFGVEITPETLAVGAPGMTLERHDPFEVWLGLTPSFYLDYVMTETNVAHAVENGIPEAQIRGWCSETLDPVFDGVALDVLFQGYVAYLV